MKHAIVKPPERENHPRASTREQRKHLLVRINEHWEEITPRHYYGHVAKNEPPAIKIAREKAAAWDKAQEKIRQAHSDKLRAMVKLLK